MFLEKFWRLLSFDLLPTLPVEFGLGNLFLLFLFSFFPAYVAYAKQSIEKRFIYLLSLAAFALFSVCMFVPIEDFYFDRGSLTVFVKTLYALLLLGALLDGEDAGSRQYRNRRFVKRFVKKYVLHPAEAFAAYLVYFMFKAMPPALSSWLGGRLGRLVGLAQRRYNALADANIRIAFPRKSAEERAKIRAEMWDMLGRYIAEPEHFGWIYRHHEKYITTVGGDILDGLKGRPFIVFAAHCGSLGLISIPFALRKIPASIMYKFPTNNLADALVTKSFGRGIGRFSFISNNANGTKEAIRVLSAGGVIYATPDQKFRTGVPTKFFGRRVKSPPGIARLAMHFGCPILPVQLVREGGLRHRIIFHAPFMPCKSRDRDLDAMRTTQKINDIIEGWIRENPSQWFWVHDRWDIGRSLEEKNGESDDP
ncbi:MAG: hypothetical protein LBO78_01010 [Rickettsiales bacterium]|jgi:KDO2-lipid IV(A) lauroyltransferase|nr:hypothetical protein [Rickettsiales bacterium]